MQQMEYWWVRAAGFFLLWPFTTDSALAQAGQAKAPPTEAGTPTQGVYQDFFDLPPVLWEWLGKSMLFVVVVWVAARMLRPAVRRGIAEGLEKAAEDARNELGDVNWDGLFANSVTRVTDLVKPELRKFTQSVMNDFKRLVDSNLGKPLMTAQLGDVRVSVVDAVRRERGEEIFQPVEGVPEDTIARDLKEVERVLDSDDSKRGLELLLELVEKHPQEFRVFERLAQFYLQAGDGQQALALLKPYRERFEGESDYFRVLGLAYQNVGELELALEAKLRAIELSPEDYSARTAAAFSYWTLEQIEEAISEASKALRLAEEQKVKATQRAKVQNSLAYYLAARANPQDRSRALDLIEAALAAADRAAYLDTKAYVLIRFSRTREELEQAWGLLAKAIERGLDRAVAAQNLQLWGEAIEAMKEEKFNR